MYCRFSGLAAIALLLPLSVQAEESDWRIDVGGGMVIAPRYTGSSDTTVKAIPYGEAAYKDLALATVRGGRALIEITPLRRSGFYAGIESSVLFGQDETKARLPAGFGDIGAAAEIGVLAGFEVRAFKIDGRVRQAVSGHKGMTADFSASVRFPVPGTLNNSRPTIVSVGPTMSYGDGDYANRYFGIDTGRAGRTGLAVFEPDNVWSYGGSAMVIQPIWKNLSLVAIGSYSRLNGDAARSPIVQDRGGVFGLVAIAWRFGG
jgi:MipA family protein